MVKPRALILTALLVLVGLIGVMFALRGGGGWGVVPGAAPPGPGVVQQAAALAARGDHEGAARLYRQGLRAAPEDGAVWYALGVSLSHLDQREAAGEAFRQVLRYGRPNSEEVRLARGWLVKAGMLAEPAAFTATSEAADGAGDKGSLKGKITWGEPDPNRSGPWIHIVLEALDGAGKGDRFATRALLGQSYQLEHLPAGSFRLTGGIGARRFWELRVAVEAGREVVLDLGKDNSGNPTAKLFE